MIKRTLKILAKVAWFIPAFLLWACYPPIGERTDVFFAIAPLIWFARNRAPGESFKLWFWNGFIFWFGTLAWMPAIVKNGGPWPLVVMGWGGLAAYCALYFGLFGYLSSRIWRRAEGAYRKRLAAIFIAEPVLWAGLELVRSNLMGGFAWNHLGVAAVKSGFGAGASLGGVYVLSMMIVLVNGTVASIAERILTPWLAARRKQLQLGEHIIELDAKKSDDIEKEAGFNLPRWTRSVETVLPMILVFSFHYLGKSYVPEYTAENSRILSVGLIQRNFPCVFKAADEEPWKIYENLFSCFSGKTPDLIVLPESAFAEFNLIGSWQCEEWARWMLKRSRAKGVIGGGGRKTGTQMYNSAALYQYDSTDLSTISLQVYDKVHLVPFGEYIPGDELIPALKRFAPVGSCKAGEPKVLEFNGFKLGVAICFEDTDSQLIRKFADMGADALVFITNDSWFYGSEETEQHAWQAVSRAVETGLPVIRVGNSGVSGVIYPDGTSHWLEGEKKGELLVDKAGCGFAKVMLPKKDSKIKTPYTRYGDIPLTVLFAIVLSFAFFKFSFHRKI
jgi:apolipoprotein N-acyltransferase